MNWPSSRIAFSAIAFVMGLAVGYQIIPRPVSQPSPSFAAPEYRVALAGAHSFPLILPSLVAYAEGYFANEGIEVTQFNTAPGSVVRNSLIAGQIDFALLAFVHTPLAYSKGIPLRIVLSLHDREIFSLIVRQQLAGTVKTVADLKGHTVGITAPGSGTWAFARAFLSGSGLDPDRDVKLISLGGDTGAIYAALASGRIDAFPSWEPLTSRALASQVAFPLIKIWEPDEHRKWLGDVALSQTLVTRQDVIQRDPVLVQKMVNAHKSALAYIRHTSPEHIIEQLFQNSFTKQYFSNIEKSLAISIIEKIKPGFGNGSLSKTGYENAIRFCTQQSLIDAPVPFESVVDLDFAGGRE